MSEEEHKWWDQKANSFMSDATKADRSQSGEVLIAAQWIGEINRRYPSPKDKTEWEEQLPVRRLLKIARSVLEALSAEMARAEKKRAALIGSENERRPESDQGLNL